MMAATSRIGSLHRACREQRCARLPQNIWQAGIVTLAPGGRMVASRTPLGVYRQMADQVVQVAHMLLIRVVVPGNRSSIRERQDGSANSRSVSGAAVASSRYAAPAARTALPISMNTPAAAGPGWACTAARAPQSRHAIFNSSLQDTQCPFGMRQNLPPGRDAKNAANCYYFRPVGEQFPPLRVGWWRGQPRQCPPGSFRPRLGRRSHSGLPPLR